MTIILYILFILYCFLRFYFLFSYKKVQKIVFEEEEKMRLYYQNEGTKKEEYSRLHDKHTENTEKLQKLYTKDQNCKYFGALVLGIVSLVCVFYKPSHDLIIMLPAILTLFNTFFNKFEIKVPWEYTKITAKFFG